MTDAELLEAYDAEERTRTGGAAPGFHIEWDGPVLRMIGPGPEASSNAVLFAHLDQAGAEEAIARQIAFFGAQGRSFEWKHFSHDRPSDLPRRLKSAGFKAEEPETFVALDLSREIRTPAPEGVEIRRIEDPATFGVIGMVNRAVYGDAGHAAWLQRVIKEEKCASPDSIVVYAAFAAGSPVGVGWMRHRPGDGFGSLWGGSTLDAYRGRGIYSSLVAVRAEEARKRGCRWLTVDCSPMSLPILERNGFRRLALITPFTWPS
jgi:GNAT superfamily N-acetyltransferase